MLISANTTVGEQNDEGISKENRLNIHQCPSCGCMSLKGMPGGRDAVCGNCGFKEPCCSD